jgi:N-acetylmuramoyl-L-alanine amidase
MQLLRRGDHGPAVTEVRSTLRHFGLLADPPIGTPTDRFDAEVEHAVRAFQQQRGLIADGIVGPATYRALHEAGWKLGDRMLAYLISSPMSGDDVVALQERLAELGFDPGRPGGVFDERTEAALRRFQREYGLVPDGLCGPATLRSLRQLGRKVTGGRPHLMREQELVRQAGPRLRGKRIVVDPGHGGPDRGVVVGGVAEADLMWDLARRLVGRMAATGMDAMLSRRRTPAPRRSTGPRSPTAPTPTWCSPCTPTPATACTPRAWPRSTSAARGPPRLSARRWPVSSTASC